MDLSTRMKISTICLLLFQNSIVVLSLYNNNFDKCPDYNPQNELDIDLISGIWQGAEIITHYRNNEDGKKSEKFSSCVTLAIEEISSSIFDYDDEKLINVFDTPGYYRFLKLSWQEYHSSEYVLKFSNTRRGLWIGTEAPRGSAMRRHPQHAHFTGTIQVMKAVGTHLVLTFCERNELFTIILFREKNVKAHDVIEPVHALLDRRGLAVQSIQELCRYNSSTRVGLNFKVFILTLGTTIIPTIILKLLSRH